MTTLVRDWCDRCRAVTEHYPTNGQGDYLVCAPCKREAAKRWYQAHRDRALDRMANRRLKLKTGKGRTV